jgi:hypothetical protein
MTRVSRDRNNQEPKERAAQQLVWWPSSLARTHKLPHRIRLRPQRLRQQPPRFQLLRRARRARRAVSYRPIESTIRRAVESRSPARSGLRQNRFDRIDDRRSATSISEQSCTLYGARRSVIELRPRL